MNGMTNLWGFEKQTTLSRLTGGRFGLMQTGGRPVIVTIHRGTDTIIETINVNLDRQRGLQAPDIQNITTALNSHLRAGDTIESVQYEGPGRRLVTASSPEIDQLRAGVHPSATPVSSAPSATQQSQDLPANETQERYQQHLNTVRGRYAADVTGLNNFLSHHGSTTHLDDNPTPDNFRSALEEARHIAEGITDPTEKRNTLARLEGMQSRFESTNSHLMRAVQEAESQVNGAHPNFTQATATLEQAESQYIRSNTESGNGGSHAGAADATAPSAEERRMNLQAQIDANNQSRIWAREDAVAARQQAMQAQAFAASRPNDAAQVISSIMNPIAGTFVGLGTAAAMASWGGNCYGGMGGLGGFGGMGGGGVNPFLPMSVASTFMNSGFNCGGGFNAMGGAGGGMGGLDLIGMGNTFYGQALDERSRGRRLDAEINRLKAMIMMGNFDAILQAVTLLTLRSKGMLRQTAVAMINSVQTSNRQMEEQNRRLEALSSTGPNASSSSDNQHQMMMINNNIQGINMDRQTAMNALRDMMSNLEEATSSEQNLRRSFEQIRQIQNRA